MSLDITQLRSVTRQATMVALDIYDKGADLLPLIAQTVRQSGQRLVTLEWWEVFPQMVEWIGDRKTQAVFGDRIEVEVKPYEVTFKMDRMNFELDGESSLIKAPQDLCAGIARAFEEGKIIQAFTPLRANTLSYDGQNFFDTDHTHPDDSTFSNVVDLSDLSASRGSTGAPTMEEAANEFSLAVERLQAIRLRRQTLAESPSAANIVVVTKSLGTWGPYEKLRTMPVYSDESGNLVQNPYAGTFRHIRDYDPASGTEKSVDFILAEPNGPRPSIFVDARGPSGIEFDETNLFSSRIIFFGSDMLGGFAAGFPQTAVRVQE